MKKYSKILILITFFISINFWHPFKLGYYSDDWSYLGNLRYEHLISPTPFNVDILVHYLNCFGNRPLTAIFWYIGYSIFNDSNIVGWQIYILLIALSFILTFRLFYLKFIEFIGVKTETFLDEIPAYLFVVLPWILSYSNWISVAMSAPAITFFNLSLFYLFKNWNERKNGFFLSSLFLALSLFTYESNYFQWIIFLLIGFIFAKEREISKKSILKSFTIFFIIQILAIVWNRLSVPYFSYLVVKSTNTYLIQTFAANLISIPFAIISSFWEHSILLVPLFLILLFTSFQKGKWRLINRKNTIFLYILFFIGIIISLGLFSAVGYSVWGLGGRSRTTIVFSLYFLLMFGLIINLLSRKSFQSSKYIKLCIIVFIILFSWNSVRNSLDWSKSWDIQQAFISRISIEQIKKTNKEDLILIDAQFKYKWVSVFDAQWAIYSQLNYGRLILNKLYGITSNSDTSLYRKFVVGKNIIHPVKNTKYTNYWDGEKLYQFYDEVGSKSGLGEVFYSKQLSYSGKNLWIWNFYDNSIKQVEKGSTISLEPLENYDYWLTKLYFRFKSKK